MVADSPRSKVCSLSRSRGGDIHRHETGFKCWLCFSGRCERASARLSPRLRRRTHVPDTYPGVRREHLHLEAAVLPYNVGTYVGRYMLSMYSQVGTRAIPQLMSRPSLVNFTPFVYRSTEGELREREGTDHEPRARSSQGASRAGNRCSSLCTRSRSHAHSHCRREVRG